MSSVTSNMKSIRIWDANRFVYGQKTGTNGRLLLQPLHMFIRGYIREIFMASFIENDIIHNIINFYGITYLIRGPPPSVGSCDYVIPILTPLKRMGISWNYHLQLKVTSLQTNFALRNFVCDSDIIQINDQWIHHDLKGEDVEKLLYNCKHYTPSYIVLRCKKHFLSPGLHIRFDITVNPAASDERFPYFKLNKSNLTNILKEIFPDKVDIIAIYGDKHIGALSMFLFIYNIDHKSCNNEQLKIYEMIMNA
eukprot:479891_1